MPEDAKQIEEAFTNGLVKAISKGGVRTMCDCGFVMPKYPGRYPSKCPHCGKAVSALTGGNASAPNNGPIPVSEPGSEGE